MDQGFMTAAGMTAAAKQEPCGDMFGRWCEDGHMLRQRIVLELEQRDKTIAVAADERAALLQMLEHVDKLSAPPRGDGPVPMQQRLR